MIIHIYYMQQNSKEKFLKNLYKLYTHFMKNEQYTIVLKVLELIAKCEGFLPQRQNKPNAKIDFSNLSIDELDEIIQNANETLEKIYTEKDSDIN